MDSGPDQMALLSSIAALNWVLSSRLDLSELIKKYVYSQPVVFEFCQKLSYRKAGIFDSVVIDCFVVSFSNIFLKQLLFIKDIDDLFDVLSSFELEFI